MRKQRVAYSKEEWHKLAIEGKKILTESPDISSSSLLVWSMGRVFPEDRHIGKQSIINNKIKFHNLVTQLIKEPKESEKIETPDFTILGNYLNEAFKQVNHKIEEISKPKEQQVSINSFDQFEYIKRKIDKLETLITETKGLLVLVIKTLDPNFFVKEDEKEIIEQLTPKKVLLKIGVVGLLGEQAHMLSEKCHEICSLTPFTNVKESTIKGFKNFDFVIVTRHAKHMVSEKVKSDLGHEKLIRLNTTSISHIYDTIVNLVNNETK